MSDETVAIPREEIVIDEKLRFVEEPIEIMDRELKGTRHSRIRETRKAKFPTYRTIQNPDRIRTDSVPTQPFEKSKQYPHPMDLI